MIMTHTYTTLYEIYKSCYPNHYVSYNIFIERLNLTSNHIEYSVLDTSMIGFSVYDSKAILLLCIDPRYQRMGYGTQLLHKTEESMISKGCKQIALGAGEDYLFPGVPMLNDSYLFFAGCGYRADWISSDLILNKEDINPSLLHCVTCPESVTFRYAKEDEMKELQDVVHHVNPDWTDYFSEYHESMFVALEHNKIIGFEFLYQQSPSYCESEEIHIGEIACVGVAPEGRSRGVGHSLVAKGTTLLMEKGCDKVFIGYTHLKDWYCSLGYSLHGEHWMGRKEL